MKNAWRTKKSSKFIIISTYIICIISTYILYNFSGYKSQIFLTEKAQIKSALDIDLFHWFHCDILRPCWQNFYNKGYIIDIIDTFSSCNKHDLSSLCVRCKPGRLPTALHSRFPRASIAHCLCSKSLLVRIIFWPSR